MQRYQSMRQELTIITQKVQELDAERTEHAYVLDVCLLRCCWWWWAAGSQRR